MTPVERITALESLIYAYCRRQFQVNDVPPDEARIVMECVLSKFRWNCIDAATLGKMLGDQQGKSGKEMPNTSDGPVNNPPETNTEEKAGRTAEDTGGNLPGKEHETEVNVNADNPD